MAVFITMHSSHYHIAVGGLLILIYHFWLFLVKTRAATESRSMCDLVFAFTRYTVINVRPLTAPPRLRWVCAWLISLTFCSPQNLTHQLKISNTFYPHIPGISSVEMLLCGKREIYGVWHPCWSIPSCWSSIWFQVNEKSKWRPKKTVIPCIASGLIARCRITSAWTSKTGHWLFE